MSTANINYWAAVTAALLTFFLGGLWYSPALFESVWIKANGYDEAQVKQIQAALGPAVFGATVLAYTLMALVFAMLMALFNIHHAAGGVLLGFMIWLGFVAPAGITVTLFSVRPLSAWLIDAGFQLVFLLMTGLILGLWRTQ